MSICRRPKFVLAVSAARTEAVISRPGPQEPKGGSRALPGITDRPTEAKKSRARWPDGFLAGG